MLDILKKADQPLASQAREAIRWLERQLISEDAPTCHPHYRHRDRSRAQVRLLKDEDMASWAQVCERSSIPTPCSAGGGDEKHSATDLQQHSLHSLSLGKQTTLRALLGNEAYLEANFIVAYADIPPTVETQADLIKRLLVDDDELDQILEEYFPGIFSEMLLHISEVEIAKAAFDEATFRSMRQAKLEQGAANGDKGEPRSRDSTNRRERRFNKSSSNYQNARNRTPNSSTSSERSPISESFTNSPFHSSSTSSLPGGSSGCMRDTTSLFSSETYQRSRPTPPRQTQPNRRHASVSPLETGLPDPAHTASTEVIPAGGISSTRSYGRQDKSHLASTPRITLANPQSTARSLSTAT